MYLLPFDEFVRSKIERLFRVRSEKTPLEFLRDFKKLYIEGGSEYPIFMCWYRLDYWEHLYLFGNALRKGEFETAVRELEILHMNDGYFYSYGVWRSILDLLDKFDENKQRCVFKV